MNTDSGIAISVVIPTLNEEAVIGRCLESLARQTFPHQSFEVIVVDNGSRDGTVDLALGFRESLRLRVLSRKGVPASALRNLGAEAAAGHSLAFLDADCIAGPDWLARAMPVLRTAGCGVIGASYTIPDGSSWVARTWYGHMRTERQGPVSYVPAGTMLISRKTFLALGGFDETIATSEDCEFCQRAAAADLPVEGIPFLSVVHLGTPQTLGAFFQKQRWHGTDVHKVFLRNTRSAAHAKSALFALYTVCSLGALILGTAAAVLAKNIAIALGAGALVLAVPLLLGVRGAVQRKRWQDLAPLAILFLVYGFARGLCLLGLAGARRAAPEATQA